MACIFKELEVDQVLEYRATLAFTSALPREFSGRQIRLLASFAFLWNLGLSIEGARGNSPAPHMSSANRSTLPLVIFGTIIAYLAADFLIFNGPLRRTIQRDNLPETELVARVAGHPVTRSQLERAIGEQLWLQGKSTITASTAERKIAHNAALDDLIDHTLLRLQVHAESTPLDVTEEEVSEFLRRLVGRFESKGALETAMKSQGITSEENLCDRLAARIRQEKFIEAHIRPSIQVTDAEAREWFEKNQAAVSFPARVKARHLFLPTLDHPPEEAKKRLEAALVDLTGKIKDFPTLAREISEDPATKDTGGELGWMTQDRLPADFGAPVFSLPVNQPTLLRTRLGWHLVELTERKAAEPRAFEQAKYEIFAGLEAIKRRKAIEDFRKALRKTENTKIEVFANPDSP
jgi:parvulin-like peptidyl-prolyl isomerase